MRWYKITAFMYRDYKVLIRSKWKFMEFFYFPITTVLIWGLFSVYSMSFGMEAGLMVLVVNVFWSFSYICQSSVNLFMSEDSWSGSLKQLIASGVSEFEYISARIISGSILSFFIMGIMLFISYFFGFQMVATHPGVILSLVLTTYLVSMALAIFVAGIIIFFGRSYTFLSWSALQAFILLSAPFFPVEILPIPFQIVALFMPYTRIFTALRIMVETGTFSALILYEAFLVGIAYLLFSLPMYYYAFKRARRTGELVRMS
jgi:ABC-2 type transport system permease protein